MNSQIVKFGVLLVAAFGLTKVSRGGDDQLAKQPPAASQLVDATALRRTIEDLTASFGRQYPRGEEFLARLDEIESQLKRSAQDGKSAVALLALQKEALLANPLLDFERLLLVRRKSNSPTLGLPMNWQATAACRARGSMTNSLSCHRSNPMGH